MQYFNIQVASQLSGVASATIRAWEKRYNAVVPDRAENKHRLYSEKDIEKLALLYKLTELGQSIGKIAHLELSELKLIYSTLLHRPYDERHVVTPHHDKVDYDKILASLHLALEAYKLDIISHEFEKARNLVTPRDLCLNILIPLFQQIGLKVSRGELSVAQEHTLSAIVSSHIGQMMGHHYQKTSATNDLILITTPEGEMHQIGILAAALLCVHYSIKFIFLGASLPAVSLAEAANALQPSAILLGTTRYQLDDHNTLEDYLSQLRSNLHVPVNLMLGGNIKGFMKNDLDKQKTQFFPTLQALDEFLAKKFKS
ncbi:MAG: MerR family transcriptional regulator [Bdellovibrionota bacterium]